MAVSFKKNKSQKNNKAKTKVKNKVKTKRPPIWPYLLTALIILVAILFVAFVIKYCKVTTIYVDGNVHYSNDEIADIVMDGRFGDNSVYLFLKYRNREIKDVPFVETMSVSIESFDTIRITVYEKKLAGYVEYLDRYLYFDRDGTVVESSIYKTNGIPLVTGIPFEYAILYEPLPVENKDIFEKVLDITQLINKYELDVDRIHFATDYSLILYFDDIEVIIGDDDFIDEKIMVLPDILLKLDGLKGLINLSDYKSGDTITFESK